MIISDLEGSLLSVASAHQSLQISNKSLVSSSISSLTKVSVTSPLPTNQDSSTFTQKGKSTSDEKLSSSNEKQVTDKQKEVNSLDSIWGCGSVYGAVPSLCNGVVNFYSNFSILISNFR